jgi:Cu(I)/Ag(I) efflux system membrane protein CusA/SilA
MLINNIIKKSIESKFIIVIIMILIVFFGIKELNKTSIDALPDLSDVQVIVKTSYLGQSPKLVEDQITYPLSIALLSVPKAKTVRGFSFFGDSYIYIIFEDDTDIYWARSRVLEYLNQSSDKLPEGVKPTLGVDASGVGWVYQYALIDRTGTYDISQLKSMQDWFLKTELQSVEGVAEVATVGGMELSYQIILDPLKILKYNINLNEIKNKIKESNSEVGGSVIEMAEAEYMVRSKGYLSNLSDFDKIPIGILNENGTPLFLKDIATIRKGSLARRGVAELNGEGEVVGGIIVMRHGENALKTINNVKEKLEELKKGLPKEVEIINVYDRSNLIEKSIDNLFYKVLQEIIIVGLVCLVFLYHTRSALVSVIVIPISILISFIIMNYIGLSANIMSLGGIAIAIGAIVDGSIVMVENTHKHLERFLNQNKREPSTSERWSIVLNSSQEVGKAIFFSLLIITLSFIPVFALEAQEGRLFTPLALTKTIVMAVSAILSITVIPVLIGFMVKGKIPLEKNNPVNNFLIFIYKPSLKVVLNYPKLVMIISLIMVSSVYYPLKNIGSEFMPELEEGSILYMPTTLAGISIGKATQLLQQTDRLIKTQPEVKSVFGKVGRAETSTDPAPLTMFETTIMLKDKSEWREGYTIDKIIEELDLIVNVPSLTNAWVQPIKTRIDMLSTGIKTPIGLKISGNNIVELQKIGMSVENILNKIPETKSAFAERSSSGRYIDITPLPEMYSRYDLTLSDIQDVIKYAIGGMKLDTLISGEERYSINMRYPIELRDDIEKIKKIPVITKNGNYLPLELLAKIEITEGAPVLKSENGRLISWVFIDTKNISIGDYIKKAKLKLDTELELPNKYSYSFAGQYEYMERVESKMYDVVPLIIAVIFILLMIIFNSVIQASMIMLTLPFALAGSAWLIFFLDFNFSVAVAIGLIALAGVASEFGVLMIVYLNSAIKDKKESGNYNNINDLKSALLEGAVMRIRPKAMTVATIFFGLLPIMWGSGTGNEVMQKIAAPMIGGMITAPLLSLFILPALYLLVYKRDFNEIKS